MSQIEANINDSNQMILIESRTMRDEHVYRDDVLEKVKVVPSLPDTLEITFEMAAEYYDVSPGTIRAAISRNRDEFNQYGELRILKGKALKEFKSMFQDEMLFKGASSLNLLNRRGLLRIGMILTESEVASSVRNYLLNIEEGAGEKLREWAVEREISKRERRRLTDSIQSFYEGPSMKGHEYKIFTDLVYKVIFDCNSAKLRTTYDLEKNEPLRDCLTTEDLKKVVEVEQIVASYIRMGKEYSDIRDELLINKDRFQ
ncbi:hypothetical protein [Bacillus altitudinis]|uniref:hypothetical protein n=1 Tax=Bacillus altitudinis TaxID=293387 RepID=UPI0025555886|nr:hypothetical protein [Bacillus altitudinis]